MLKQRQPVARPLCPRVWSMRAVLQRVASAKVEVEGQLVGSIGRGLLVLVGVKATDIDKDTEYVVRKILNARLWPNAEGGKAWDQSLTQMQYEVLVVSQFTLLGYLKGNKPDYHLAMPPEQAQEVYNELVHKLQSSYLPNKVSQGTFGAMMQVSLVNDGPVTLQLDSDEKGGK